MRKIESFLNPHTEEEITAALLLMVSQGAGVIKFHAIRGQIANLWVIAAGPNKKYVENQLRQNGHGGMGVKLTSVENKGIIVQQNLDASTTGYIFVNGKDANIPPLAQEYLQQLARIHPRLEPVIVRMNQTSTAGDRVGRIR